MNVGSLYYFSLFCIDVSEKESEVEQEIFHSFSFGNDAFNYVPDDS